MTRRRCPLPTPQGVGRRYAHVVLRKADIDLTKRAGELTEDEVSGAGGPWGHPGGTAGMLPGGLGTSQSRWGHC